MKFSACIEWLFADVAPTFPERIHAAKAAGLDAVEFWKWSGKDIDGIESALQETGLKLTGFVAEPMIALTDPSNKEAFLAGLGDSISMAKGLGASVLIAQAGNDIAGVSQQDQRTALVACLKAAATVLEGSGVRLGVEPLNTLIDHKGYFLSSTAEALDIMDEVGSPSIGIVYDLYHSAVMGEDIEDVLNGRIKHVFHAHIADHPGRGAPGTGTIDLGARLDWLLNAGYDGFIGLEYKPSGNTTAELAQSLATLHHTQSL